MATNKTDKVLNVPTLRFPGFTEEWQKSALGDICTVQMCKRIFAHQTSEVGDVPFYKIGTIGGIPDSYISKELFDEYRCKYNYPQQGEVMITCAGTVGKAIPFDGADSYFQDSNIVWLSNPTDKINNKFLYYIISRVDWSRLNSTTITRIYNDDLRKLGISYPNRTEQKKIADFLSLLDDRIALQSKLIEDLKKLKSAITELLFNNDASKVRLGTLIKQVSARNRDGLINIVMSVSNKHGFIAQSEQFEDRTVASEDTTNYKVIKSGIFAYNPARINVGSIAQYKGDETCIVSPMYLCFKCGVDVVGDYLEHFFSTKYFFKEMDKRLEGSVRQCLSFEALCNIPIPLPSIEQQHCTATIIGGISKMIAAESKILQAYTKQKNYLLSTMFI
ncbi:restriction endonuclease subunit S [Muribaculaceae bacterium Isolate-039 (Harlan)]|nr:restriction endonuclease subunit S [Muribaculaceae bacterium Isolate-039 (Harlan)]